ncbi:MAG: hypothetical protein RMM17_08690 [Acidobacteriota bacterium]|nr:hypothetical protein [Blastocatellia bacterium]MDW8412742.1 hypothetical protein [Acidobacteriota bacterium]
MKKAVLLIATLISTYAFLSSTSTEAQKKRLIGLAPKRGVDYSKFSHTTHNLECSKCHEVKEGEKAYKFPTHDACNECHNFVPFRLAAPAFCMICHDNQKNYSSVRKSYTRSSSDFGTKFPHSAHIGLNGVDFDKSNPDLYESLDNKLKKVQLTSKDSGCIECHLKDGPEKKEQNFSIPNHPECFRCHGSKPETKVPPFMQDCLGCHKPWLREQDSVSGLFPTFYHDDTHEYDSRPKPKGKSPEERDLILKERAKDLTKNKKLKCQYCHDVNKSVRLADIGRPLQSHCTVCHDKQATARELTPEELGKLRP